MAERPGQAHPDESGRAPELVKAVLKVDDGKVKTVLTEVSLGTDPSDASASDVLKKTRTFTPSPPVGLGV